MKIRNIIDGFWSGKRLKITTLEIKLGRKSADGSGIGLRGSERPEIVTTGNGGVRVLEEGVEVWWNDGSSHS